MAHNKFLPRVLAAAAAMMLLAGCSSKADPGFSPANPVNITIWTYYNGEQLEAFNALVDEFNSTVGKEQGITVESSSHGSVTDLENNVLASAEGKVGAEAMPNIFSAYADTAYALDEMGQIADLSDYLSEEDRAAFIEDYLSEGDFSGSGSIKIFPVAKSAELLFLNETDWEPFAAATGATYHDRRSRLRRRTLLRVDRRADARHPERWTRVLRPRRDGELHAHRRQAARLHDLRRAGRQHDAEL